MQYQRLGKSSLHISRIGFGCMSLKPDSTDKEKIIHNALDLGINYFDTADLYDKGENEQILGNALKGKRDAVIIATKVGNQWRPDGSGWDWNPRKSYILAAIDESLGRLQTDCIDLYQLHGGTIDGRIDETIEAFEQLVQQGKIKHYGISSIRPNVIREWINRSNIVSVMMQYSLLDRRPEESCLPLLTQNGIGVLARGSLAQGLLVNKPAKPYLNYSEEEVKKAADTISSISANKRTNSQTAMQFALSNAAVTSAVVGIRTVQQLEDAVKAVEISSVTEGEISKLRRAIPPNFYTDHR